MLESAIIVLMVIKDQATKFWAAKNLVSLENQTMPIIKDVLHFTYVENTGASFSILQGKTLFLTLFSSLVIILLSFALIKYRSKLKAIPRMLLALFIAGGLGNLIDRVTLSYVRDFIDFRLINFAVFNVADICVTLAVVFSIVYIVFTKDGRRFLDDDFSFKNMGDDKVNTEVE